MKQVWTRWTVEWEFLTKVCGSVPADPALVTKWLESRQPSARPVGARSMQEINEEVVATLESELVEDAADYAMLTFQRQNGTLVLRASTLRAHMKDCARQLSSFFVGRVKGERTFARSRIALPQVSPNEPRMHPGRASWLVRPGELGPAGLRGEPGLTGRWRLHES